MNREQFLISLVLSVPVGVGVAAAVHMNLGDLGVGAFWGGVTALAIFGLLYVAVDDAPLPEERADGE